LRIKSDREEGCKHVRSLSAELLWVLREGDGVKADDAEKELVAGEGRGLERDPVAECAKVVA